MIDIHSTKIILNFLSISIQLRKQTAQTTERINREKEWKFPGKSIERTEDDCGEFGVENRRYHFAGCQTGRAVFRYSDGSEREEKTYGGFAGNILYEFSVNVFKLDEITFWLPNLISNILCGKCGKFLFFVFMMPQVFSSTWNDVRFWILCLSEFSWKNDQISIAFIHKRIMRELWALLFNPFIQNLRSM